MAEKRKEPKENAKLKRILDYLKISYWLLDLDFVLLDVNHTFLELTGAKREKVIGRGMLTLISKEEQLYVERHLTELIEGKRESVQCELYVFGRERYVKLPVLFHISINRNPKGRPVSANVLLMDISEQKQVRDSLEKEKKMLESILFGIDDSVTIFHENGQFMFGNTKSHQLHKGSNKPLLPIDSTGSKRLELIVNEKTRHFLGNIRPIYDHEGRLFAHAETLTDITNNVLLEKKERELFHFRRQTRRSELQTEMIGTGKKMEAVFETIVRCAEVDSSILIMGETGVGKEVAARAIHSQSYRKNNPFVSVNCGALPDALIESELFGHVKGAFTGAISDRAGLFREAHEGTLFLDELGELNKNMQVKILRALQEREIRPVGSDHCLPVDARIICATNRNLLTMAQNGEFRLDLYYRVAVIPLVIPPLREREQDIIKLAMHFIRKYQKKNCRHLKTLDLSTQQMLRNYHWPGNIRELENAIEHSLAMSRGKEITPECFPLQVIFPDPNSQSGQSSALPRSINSGMSTKKEDELHRIAKALDEHNGNQTAAAKALGISRVTLWRKKSMYNL